MIHLILGAACALAQTSDWRVLRDQTPSAMLVAQLNDLAHVLPGTETPEQTLEIKRRLYVGLAALDTRPTDTIRRYVNRVGAYDRGVLSTFAAPVIHRLTAREPYLRAAVAEQRRRDFPWLPGPTRRERLHERVMLAWAKLTRRVLFVKTPEAAAAIAPGVLRLERMLRDGTWTPAPLTPTDDLIEILEDWVELDWPTVDAADPKGEATDQFTRYFAAKWFAVRDLTAFARDYRERVGPADRRQVAEALPKVMSLVERVESPEVVAHLHRLRAKPVAATVSAEAELARNLKNIGFAALGELAAKFFGPKIKENLRKIDAEEARAVHWLRIEKIMRGDDRAEFVAGCERALASFSKSGADTF